MDEEVNSLIRSKNLDTLRTNVSLIKDKYLQNKIQAVKIFNRAEKYYRSLGSPNVKERPPNTHQSSASSYYATELQSERENLEKEIEREKFEKTHLLTMGSIGLALVALIVSSTFSFVNYNDSHDLMERQIESIAPQKPRLQVYPGDTRTLIFSPQGLDWRGNNNWDPEISGIHFGVARFTFYNVGRMPTGHIYFQVKSDAIPTQQQYRIINVGNIPGEGIVEAELKLNYGQDKNISGIISRELGKDFNQGIHDAEIIVNCPYCEGTNANKELIFKTKICIEIYSGVCKEFENSKDNQIPQLN